MFENFKKSVRTFAASVLPSTPAPKVRPGARSYPSYLTTATPAETALPQKDRRLATSQTTTLRNGATTPDVIRDFVAASPDLSASVFAYSRLAISRGYTGAAMNPDGTFNVEATNLLQQIMSKFDVMPDYSTGFSGTWSIRSISESWAKEIACYGACAGELVLDKARLPARVQPLSAKNIRFIPDGDILRPVQLVGSEEVDLDFATFFYTALDQDLLEPYPASFLEPALKAVIFAEDYVQDLQRVAKRSVHPRLYVKILMDKIVASAPAEAQHDPDVMTTFLNSTLSSVETLVNGLAPEDALMMYDGMEPTYMNNNGAVGVEWETLQNIINAKLSTGAKAMPAILGHGVGSQNVASSESMLFVKNAAGAVQAKINEMWSRIFTLAVRLMGHDVTVQFRWDSIDLRPDSELEAFKATKQSRVLELLSLGMITDEEASLELHGKLPPASAPKLSGTFFMSQKSLSDGNLNSDRNMGSALSQGLTPDSSQSRGSNNKTSPVKVVK